MHQLTKRDAAYLELVLAYRVAKGAERNRLFALLRPSQEKHLRFYSYKFQSPTIPIDPDDIAQAAEIGFLRALDGWDPKRGSWITSLFIWVRNEVQRYQFKEPVVYRARNVAMPYRVHRAKEAFYARTGRDATPADLGIEQKQWDKWQKDAVFQRADLEGDPQKKNFKKFRDIKDGLPSPEEAMMQCELDAEIAKLTDAERETLLGKDEDAKEDLRDRFLDL